MNESRFADYKENLFSVVVPVYNEASCVAPFLETVIPILKSIQDRFGYEYEIVFVMDPSTDDTERVIREARKTNPAVKLLILSRRFGQQPSILAGVFNCRGACCAVIDVDLQDPPELMIEMMAKHIQEGYDVVYAVRIKRLGEPWVKRVLTQAGYFWMNKLATVNIPRNVGDFRLIDRRVIEELRKLNESHGFFRGLVPFVGFRQTGVSFERQARIQGRTKYHYLWGSIQNGINALVCYSNKLLSFATMMGLLLLAASFLLLGILVYLKFLARVPVSTGLGFIAVLVLFTSGIQAFLVGIMGSYVGRIYDETKQRPLYIIDKKVGF